MHVQDARDGKRALFQWGPQLHKHHKFEVSYTILKRIRAWNPEFYRVSTLAAGVFVHLLVCWTMLLSCKPWFTLLRLGEAVSDLFNQLTNNVHHQVCLFIGKNKRW